MVADQGGQAGRESLDERRQDGPEPHRRSRTSLQTSALGAVAPGRAAPTLVTVIPEFRDDADAVGLRFIYDNGHTRRGLRRPRRWGAVSGCSTLTATAGSMSISCKGDRFRRVSRPRKTATGCFATSGDGTFEDVTDRSGLAALGRGYGHGVAVGDYDNDGRPDLFVTRWRAYAFTATKAMARSTT